MFSFHRCAIGAGIDGRFCKREVMIVSYVCSQNEFSQDNKREGKRTWAISSRPCFSFSRLGTLFITSFFFLSDVHIFYLFQSESEQKVMSSLMCIKLLVSSRDCNKIECNLWNPLQTSEWNSDTSLLNLWTVIFWHSYSPSCINVSQLMGRYCRAGLHRERERSGRIYNVCDFSVCPTFILVSFLSSKNIIVRQSKVS